MTTLVAPTPAQADVGATSAIDRANLRPDDLLNDRVNDDGGRYRKIVEDTVSGIASTTSHISEVLSSAHQWAFARSSSKTGTNTGAAQSESMCSMDIPRALTSHGREVPPTA
ncbi:hypothetical protein [Saccharothrix sp. Mg75]|uniref:hypothetical protein n=1 Tax=Saccharothrix sp. Mg75 TaxID=3445357 RepID=UPI003EEF4F52